MNALSRSGSRVGENQLAAMGLPVFFEVDDFADLGCELPDNRLGQSVRVWARSLSVMQKEAIVYSARSGKAWRLASDEGPYLHGHDYAPCPLSFLTTGMVASYMNEIQALARQRSIDIRDLELIQHNHYSIEGSALSGSMRGSALPVDLEVRIDCIAGNAELEDLVATAVHASPLDGLMRASHDSLFTLSCNGKEIETGKASALGSPALTEPRTRFAHLLQANVADPGWIDRLEAVAQGPSEAAATGLKPEQKRSVQISAACRLRPDGVKEIRQEMPRPAGSTFRFLSDESKEFGGCSRAPDAVSYISVGIAFCFMTQLGRYAKIMQKNLRSYDVIQDTHFSVGGATGGTGAAGIADPVETHLYLGTEEGEDFARQCLDMAEQTCYLHAFCRTELEPNLKITRSGN